MFVMETATMGIDASSIAPQHFLMQEHQDGRGKPWEEDDRGFGMR
jgi:hypothetical protein